MGWLENRQLIRGCQILIGLIFVWAALAKLGNLEEFATAVHNFRIVPVAVENLLAVTWSPKSPSLLIFSNNMTSI